MNIFAVDDDPELAAQMLADTHVVKMTLETGQILSTVYHKYVSDATERGFYKPTHPNHPSVLWAAETGGNYAWLRNHFTALAAEYEYRYGKVHKTWEKLAGITAAYPRQLVGTASKRTPFALAMPDKYKLLDDPVLCYRAYYKYGKKHLLKYTYRPAPSWLEDTQDN